MNLFKRRAKARTLSDDQLRDAWKAISLLIDYPSPQLIEQLPRIWAGLPHLPVSVAQPLARLVDRLATTDLVALDRAYVETFDHTRSCALYLTYFAHGDTRKRGVALVRFKQAYRRFGLELTDEELPDHLAVVCEFGATGDVDTAWQLLNDHRAGIEVLRMALTERGSAWADALVALSATLPPLAGEESAAIAALIASGPPAEEVGLEPYQLDPALIHDPLAGAASGPSFVSLNEVGVRA